MLRLSAKAEEDLIRIWQFIAAEDEAAVDRVLDMLELKSQLLAQYPEAGRSRPDVAPDFRYFPADSYLIFYRVVGDRMEIVRYVHGARLIPEAL